MSSFNPRTFPYPWLYVTNTGVILRPQEFINHNDANDEDSPGWSNRVLSAVQDAGHCFLDAGNGGMELVIGLKSRECLPFVA